MNSTAAGALKRRARGRAIQPLKGPNSMTDKTTELKRTVWLERNGYFGEPQEFPPIRFIVKRTQNTINPTVGDYITGEGAQDLIAGGYVVNIG